MSIKEHPPHSIHTPVLLNQTLAALHPAKGESYLDLTAGYGGHASAVLKRTEEYESSVLIDRDRNTAPYLKELTTKGVELRHIDFLSAAKQLILEKRTFDCILADLGVSSPQLDKPERGFSFSSHGPLDMRMDQSKELTAEFIVNSYSEDQLVDIIHRYGEEPYRAAKAVAHGIAKARPFSTTDTLAEAIKHIIRGLWKRPSRIHPATRTFQALRIEVNDELGQIKALMPLLPHLLKPGGRVALISFHSLEDRIVKHYFAEQLASGYEAELIPNKRLIDGATYDVHNPRARSAKLRVAVKK